MYPAQPQPLPERRLGYSQKVRVGEHAVHIRTQQYTDGRVAEIFIDVPTEQAPLRACMHDIARAVSIGLQHGVPLKTYADAFVRVADKDTPPVPVRGDFCISDATSVLDYVFRELALSYLGETYRNPR